MWYDNMMWCDAIVIWCEWRDDVNEVNDANDMNDVSMDKKKMR